MVAERGGAVSFSEELARKDLEREVVNVRLELHQGSGSAVAWGCDLTYDYVKINASYRS
jgi:glutamate N-acetyltransferase/amino-acid N-acetyltransferase